MSRKRQTKSLEKAQKWWETMETVNDRVQTDENLFFDSSMQKYI